MFPAAVTPFVLDGQLFRNTRRRAESLEILCLLLLLLPPLLPPLLSLLLLPLILLLLFPRCLERSVELRGRGRGSL